MRLCSWATVSVVDTLEAPISPAIDVGNGLGLLPLNVVQQGRKDPPGFPKLITGGRERERGSIQMGLIMWGPELDKLQEGGSGGLGTQVAAAAEPPSPQPRAKDHGG